MSFFTLAPSSSLPSLSFLLPSSLPILSVVASNLRCSPGLPVHAVSTPTTPQPPLTLHHVRWVQIGAFPMAGTTMRHRLALVASALYDGIAELRGPWPHIRACAPVRERAAQRGKRRPSRAPWLAACPSWRPHAACGWRRLLVAVASSPWPATASVQGLARRDGMCRGLGTDVALQRRGKPWVGDRAFAVRMEPRGACVLRVDSRVSSYLRLDARIHLVPCACATPYLRLDACIQLVHVSVLLLRWLLYMCAACRPRPTGRPWTRREHLSGAWPCGQARRAPPRCRWSPRRPDLPTSCALCSALGVCDGRRAHGAARRAEEKKERERGRSQGQKGHFPSVLLKSKK